VAEIQAIYPGELKSESIVDAIATFERSLVTVDSPFDQYLKGKADAIGAQEKAGYALFKSLGCTQCHMGKILGGQSFAKLGLERNYFAERGNLKDADNGRFNVTKDPADKHFFKVPTLRELEKTAPYFHDGTATTVKEAVQKMIRYQLEDEVAQAQIDQLVAFLKSLNGSYNGKPLD
jgi:cytochrome c peroxidase